MKEPLKVQRLNESLNKEDIASEIIYLVDKIAKSDIVCLHEAEKNYGNSWKQRGGQGAFMMLARKWDRLELQSSDSEYDIFKAVLKDVRAEGVIDDIRDLRRYLLLVEAEVIRLDTLSKNTIKKPPTPEEANYLAYAEFLEDSCETQTN